MLRSMTGYSRFHKIVSGVELTVEIHSVNKKHLDIHFKLPEELFSLEHELRKTIGEALFRGNITVTVKLNFLERPPVRIVVHKALAQECMQAALLLEKELNCTLAPTDLFSLFREHGVFEAACSSGSSHVDKFVREGLDGALEKLLQVKNEEGKALFTDLTLRLKLLEKLIGKIEKRMPLVRKKQLDKLKKEVKTLVGGGHPDAIRELALLVEKMDIAEEISRFRFHCSHFRKTVEEKKPQSIGKTLEFILQELQRETNTIGSKSQDASIAHDVILIKSELERMREQVQNVE